MQIQTVLYMGLLWGYKKDITKEINLKDFLPNELINRENVKC